MGKEYSKSSNRSLQLYCKVSYRHSGEPPIESLQELVNKDPIPITDYKQIIDDVGDNHITHMELHLIDEMPPLDILAPHLTHLRLAGNTGLQLLDYSKVSSLKRLEVLNLSTTPMAPELLNEISNCTSLKELQLTNCGLTNLPLSLKALKSLHNLDLRSNSFSKGLPEVVTQLTTLTSLTLRNCRLTKLPDSLKALINLQSFDLSNNFFSEGLPEVVTQLTTLESLSLRNCQLRNLPDSFTNLKCTKGMDISENNFPGTFYFKDISLYKMGNECSKSSNRSLQLYCKVSYRHSGEPPMRSLQELVSKDLIPITDYKQIIDDVGDNHITHMKLHLIDEMPPLDILAPHLTHLNLTGYTGLRYFDHCRIFNLKHLEVFILSDKLVAPKMLDEISNCTSLQELQLTNCGLTDLPLSLKALSNLNSLNLEDNFFFEGLPEVVTQLTTLKFLNLRKCRLTKLPDSLQSLINLENLDLEENFFFTELPEVVTQLTSLKVLNLRECRLTKLPDSFTNLKHTERIDSSENYFSSGLPFELTIRDCKDRNAEILSLETPLRFYRKPPPPPRPSRLLPLPPPPPSQPPPYLPPPPPPPPSLKQPPRPPRLLSSRLPLSPTAPSMSQSPSLPKQLQSPHCKVSYRHSGEPPIESLQELLSKDPIPITDYKQIIDDIGDNHITHMELHLIDEIPPLHILAPHLTHFKLAGNTKSQHLGYSKLSNLKHLEILVLSDTQTLLHEISKCTSLSELDLTNCGLTDLPLSLKILKNLQSLNLEDNFFSKGLPEVVTQLTTLTSLSLKNCQHTGLPDSLKALKNLKSLNLTNNIFYKGLPEIVTQLTALTSLILRNCRLTELPDSLNRMKCIEVLDISENQLTGKLQPVVYGMAKLEILRIEDIPHLEELSHEILNMNSLKRISCSNSFALRYPPYAVCQQSLSAIKKYFRDLQDQFGCSSTVPVAVVGSPMAGKTSLIRSLKAGKRELTYRNVGSPLDETTKVFNIEKLAMDGKSLRFIDFGAHEVYLLAHQLALKEQTIPLVVVSLEQFQELSERKGVREATRKHCFDWLSHLYLASPLLGAPILALTHRDKLASLDECASLVTNLLNTVESIRQEVANSEEGQILNNPSLPQKMLHVSDMSKPMFIPKEIFVFDEGQESIFDLQEHLACRCLQTTILIPNFWEQIARCIDAQKEVPYIIFSDIQEQFFEEEEIEVILRFLHNNGKIFWFEKMPNLSQYIFHQIPEIVNMIAVLFHHCLDEIWAQRIEDFVPFQHKNSIVGNTQFEHLVTRFLTTGLLDEAILFHLLEAETNFAPHVAIKLLSSFCILYGPMIEQKCSTYIVPNFSLSYIGRQWETDGYLQLRIKVVFNNLPLPRYVFQLMTVALLNFDKDVAYPAEVFHNGTSVRHGKSATHLVHDPNSGSVTIQVSTPVETISSSWQRLIKVMKFIINQTTSVWKAACPEALVYCAHCLFKQAENPDCLKNPSWLSCFDPNQSYKIWLSTKVGELPELVTCTNAEFSKTGEPAVPKQLRYPCPSLDTHAKSMLKDYLASIEEHTETKDTSKVDFNKLVLPPSEPADDDSDLSDVEEQGYVSSSASEPVLALKLYPTEKAHIQCLFNNIDKIYQMSDPIRGRAIIINNNMFYEGGKLINTRLGSEVDYENLKLLFKHLRYDLVKTQEELSDLTAEEIYSEIEQETHHQGHYKYQSFFLVLMSHGTRGDNLYDRNFRPVDLARIKDLLSPQNFPAMKGKPKVIIIQACSGDRVEFGDASTVPLLNPIPAAASAAQQSLTLKQLRQKEEEEMWGPSVDGPGLEALNLDDFFIMKAASETYKAVRSGTHGSWFIRVLVATFYKHSCHRDIEQLFKIIQQRVRQIGMTDIRTKENSSGACIPDSRCTFTNYRKMFLFPEFPPK